MRHLKILTLKYYIERLFLKFQLILNRKYFFSNLIKYFSLISKIKINHKPKNLILNGTYKIKINVVGRISHRVLVLYGYILQL